MRRIATMVMVIVAVMATGCGTMTPTQQTALGAALGAGTGLVLGNNLGGSRNDRELGAAAGALLGGYLGHQNATRQQQGTQIQALQAQMNSVVIWIVNSNGSRTPVQLIRTPDGQYVGPRGEYYQNLPTPAQLGPVYGIN